MIRLALVAVGELDPDPRVELARDLSREMPVRVRAAVEVLSTGSFRSRGHGQSDARAILRELDFRGERPFTGRSLVLGVTDEDLFSPLFHWVFGEARLGGDAAVVSRHRLRNEHYGIAPDAATLQRRTLIECAHETGHMLGLAHCRRPDCVMAFSGAVEEIDLKGVRPCASCREALGLTVAGFCDQGA